MSDTTVSWSSLRRWEECHQHQLRTIQGKASSGNGRIFLPGTLADLCMRRWLESDSPQPGGMHEYLDGLFITHTGPDAEYQIKWIGDPRADGRRVKQSVSEMLTVLEPMLTQRVLPYRYQPEVKFRQDIGIPGLHPGQTRVVTMIGGMDILVQDDNDDYEVMDLKATHDDGYAKKVLGQLIFYSVAVAFMFDLPTQPKRASFLMPGCREKYVGVNITEADRRTMYSRIVRFCQGTWQNEWDPKADDDGCERCDTKHCCDKFVVPNVVDAAGKRRASFTDLAERRRALRSV